jgi:DNA-binding transcriptional MerR regulator
VSESDSKPGEYTIDQLAAKTGLPSRTIRFYQAKGVLPAPKRRGRVAFYDESHAERLKMVSELQDKGLRLRAIRDFILTPDADSESVQQWLGIGERIDHTLGDAPQLMTEQELDELFGRPIAPALALLKQRNAITAQGQGLRQRYLVASPALLKIAVRLERAGISLETALRFQEILARQMQRAAQELVEHALSHLGKGFGRSARPEDVAEAVQCLEGDGPAGQATFVIFGREIQRAIAERFRT